MGRGISSFGRALAWHARGDRFESGILHKNYNRSRGRFFCCFYEMGFQVYIIYSATLDKYYVGQTENVKQRLEQHNSGVSKFTSSAKDWEIKYLEAFGSREAALKREKEIKNKKSRKYIQWLINDFN
jgi:putative endonuclease